MSMLLAADDDDDNINKWMKNEPNEGFVNTV